MSTDEMTGKGPRKIRREAPPPGTEDRAQPGWPALTTEHFVEADYYEQFRPGLRPAFEAGAQVGEAMSLTDAQKQLASAARPFRVVTAVNVDDREVVVPICGPGVGSVLHVTVPAFGVLRAPDDVFQAGLSGARIQRWHLIGAAGECGGEQMTLGSQMVDKCDRYGCRRHDEPDAHGHWRHAHTVKQAQRFLKSCGQPLYGKAPDGRERVLHLPRHEPYKNENSMVPAARIARFLKHVDNRPPVQIFATWRRMELDENEREYEKVLQAGGSVPGR